MSFFTACKEASQSKFAKKLRRKIVSGILLVHHTNIIFHRNFLIPNVSLKSICMLNSNYLTESKYTLTYFTLPHFCCPIISYSFLVHLGKRGHRPRNYTGPQSFMNAFSHLLTKTFRDAY